MSHDVHQPQDQCQEQPPRDGSAPALANASNWLRLVFHVLTCNNQNCQLGERCANAKVLLSHVLTCDWTNAPGPAACSFPACSTMRRLLMHWMGCQDSSCRLCSGVWHDLAAAPPPQQQQHQPPCWCPATPQRHQCRHSDKESRDGGDNVDDSDVDASGGESGFAAAGPGPSDRFVSGAKDGKEPMPANATSSAGSGAAGTAMLLDLSHPADRAAAQLQEATAFLQYLLYCLMSKTVQGMDARTLGMEFWANVLAPPPPAAVALCGALPGYPPPPHNAAAAAYSAPFAGLPVECAPPVSRPSAGRRLLQHRLACRNRRCAMCAGTCDLFTRRGALAQFTCHPPPARPASRHHHHQQPHRHHQHGDACSSGHGVFAEMDSLVQELSLALAWIQL